MLQWVENHFYPELQAWLPTHLPRDPKIFVDLDIEVGSQWPEKLCQALRGSRYMVAIWTPDYFRSPWCRAELATMRERAVQLGMGTELNPDGLVYPIQYADGEHYPKELEGTQRIDLREFNIPHKVFRESVLYIEFSKRIQHISEYIAKKIVDSPPWQPDWPVITPGSGSLSDIPLPRLK